jgi:two-component system response regulator
LGFATHLTTNSQAGMPRALLTKPIVMADDDEGDRLLTKKAMEINLVPNPFVAVANGEQLLDYLYRRGKFLGLDSPLPCFILLDLNMPRIDGREALRVIKSDEKLKNIPVVILTTSRSPEDLIGSYDMGANSYIAKPNTYEELVKIVRSLKEYWLEIVDLPPDKARE